MTYMDWLALGVWCMLMGALMFLWGIDELRYSLSPHPWTDHTLCAGLMAVLIGAVVMFYGMGLLGRSCDARPCPALQPGILEYMNDETL